MTRQSDPPDGDTPLSTYAGHNTPDSFQRPWLKKLSWSPAGQQIASIGSQGKGAVHVWDPFTGKLSFTYNKQKGYLEWTVDGRKKPVSLGGISWSPMGDQIASSSRNGTVHVFNTRRSLSGGRTALVYSRDERAGTGPVAWSPDGRLIACAGSSGFSASVDVFSASTGATQWIWQGPQGASANTAVAWSPDSSRLAMSNSWEVYLFDSRTGKKMGECRSPQMRPNTRYHSQIKDISWSPDGRYIASTGDCIELWDSKTCAQKFRYDRTDEDGYLNAIAWSPTDGRLASSSARAVHIWDALDAVQLASFPHAAVFTLDWSPDSTYIASGAQDCFVRVWRT